MHCWWECRLVQPLWKTVWNFLKKLKMELPSDLAIHCWDYTQKILKHQFKKNLCTPIFIAAQFIIAKCFRQPKHPTVNEWIKKLQYIYTMEFYTAER